MQVALSGFEAHADAYYAQDLGLFKRDGLNITITQLAGGEAIVAAIVSGAVQIGAGNPLPLALAHEHGFNVVLVAPGAITDASLPPIGGLLVATNAPIHSGKDMNGRTVAVNTLHSVDQIGVSAWVDQTGGDAKTLKFLEVPNITMVDAVADGRIDGALIADPGYSVGLASGRVRSLGDANTAIARRYMTSAWFATRSWADANPEATRKFAADINEASAWATKNPEAAAAILKKYMKFNYTSAHERHSMVLTAAMVQPLLDAAYRYKTLPQPLDAHDLIWTAPATSH